MLRKLQNPGGFDTGDPFARYAAVEALRPLHAGRPLPRLASPRLPPAPPVETPPVEDQTREEKVWIAFEVVDRLGKPVEGIPYRLEGPEGEEEDGRLPANGQVRKDGIDPGTWRFTLASVDATTWEVVG